MRDEGQAVAAFELATQQGLPFDALLCDYRLADGADGLDIGLRLRQRFASGLPLLMVTGETAPQRLQKVHASSVAVLFKPVLASDLLAALASLNSENAAVTQ